MNSENEICCTVVVSTFNRCDSLGKTLKSLCSLDGILGVNYEIIVVDNNSSDGTKELVEEYKKSHKGVFRYIFEAQQGVSYARNAGVKMAQGEIIVFTDDVVGIDKKWLINILGVFKTYDCDAIGGRILPFYLEPAPSWIKDNEKLLGGPIVSYDYGEDVKPFDSNHMVPFVGANMAYRKKCLNDFGGFRADLGPSTGAMGDDTEFFLRLFEAGKKLYYAGNALVWHKTEKNRMSLRYLSKWFISGGRYLERIKWKSGLRSEELNLFHGVPLCYVKIVLISGVCLILAVFNKREFLKKWKELFCSIGMIVEYRSQSVKK